MKLHQILFALVSILSFSAVSTAKERPNILFIFSDDHAHQALGAYNSYLKDVVRTPNLDKLAGQGMLFEKCMVTNSICGPMRATILSGKYSHLNGFWRNNNQFDATNQITFPKLLQEAGYQTAVIGKWHLGEHQAPQGFNYSEVLMGQGPYHHPVMLKDAKGSGINEQRTKEKHQGYVTDIITDLSIEWLENGRDKSKPFMLMAQHKAPHREWSPKPEVYKTWSGVKIPEPATLFENYDEMVKPRQLQQMTIAKHFRKGYDDKTNNFAPPNLTKEQAIAYRAMFAEENAAFEAALPTMSEEDRVRWIHQRYVKIFLASIQSVDDSVGRLLKYLEDNNLADNTIVIYSSDQGFYLGEHGWYDKRWAYEESVRTPFIVRWPGNVKPGSRNTDLVSALDFAQTFLDIAGLDQPAEMQGRSLVPVFKSRTPDDWRESHYYHYYEHPGYHAVSRHYAVCTAQHKLICFYNEKTGEKIWELIDLKADPLETKNFYNDPAYADLQKDLHTELDRLRKLYQVPEVDPAFIDNGKNQH